MKEKLQVLLESIWLFLGVKIWNIWVIPKEAEKPVDKRIKTKRDIK